jgi:agmatine deiminase
MRTPKQDGFKMPAEWAAHARTWMMWPSRAEIWGNFTETRKNYAAVAHAIRDFEPLTMLVRKADMAEAKRLLGSDIDLLESPINDSWCRDAGPCFLVNDQGRRAGAAFTFNAWGEKYSPYDGDNAAADVILNAAGVPIYHSQLIAEGGGVSVDGEGTILTTETCFLNKNRNPSWTKAAVEEELKQMLGGSKVIWLPGNVEETETDGHVDGIATFVAPGVVLMEGPGAPDADWHHINQANIDAMAGQIDAKGRKIEIHLMPDAADYVSDCEKFCRSYVNSYIVNGGIVMPKYGVKTDDAVREIFEGLFPNRRISMVEIPEIAIGGGGIHCITQQEPA